MKMREGFACRRSPSRILPVSTGALGVQLCRRTIRESGLDCEKVLGVEIVTVTDWDSERQRVVRRKTKRYCDALSYRLNQVVACFHGGRNETLYSGPTPVGWVHDFDLKGAYTTGMVFIRPVDYAAAFSTTRVQDFIGDVMGFAKVHFSFPEHVRYPCLPQRSELRGLIYPRVGISYATAPEIELAHTIGAELTFESGVVFPWLSGTDTRVFLRFVQEIRRLRNSYPPKSLFEQTAKLLGNSVYGKVAQGLGGKTVFDTASMDNHAVPPSSLTNAPMAAITTGLIRAVVSEIMHRLPPHRQVFAVTTDGIQCDAGLDEIDISGPLCQRYLQLCALVEERL